MDSWVGHQVSLELGNIDVESTVESQRSSDRADNLADQSVQVGVGGPLNVQIPSADIVNSLVVNHESTVRVLQGGVGGQDRVVGLNNSGRDLRCGINCELQL